MDQLMLTPQERELLDLTAAPLTDERRDQLATFVMSEIGREPKRSRRKLFGFLAAIVAMLTISSGVAYALFSRTADPSDPYLGYCYQDTHLERGDDWIGTTIMSASRPGSTAKAEVDAVTTCAELWDLGVVHPPGPAPTREAGNPVPVLTACVDDTGATVVLPAPAAICDQLGIASLR